MIYSSSSQIKAHRRNLLDRLYTWNETRRVSAREKRLKTSVEIKQLNTWRPLNPQDVPLVFVTHNDSRIIEKFLNHYRGLGVTRFICIDDASSDGTLDYLLSHTDVDLWQSPLRYSEARRGRQWREQIFEIYGRSRWYVNVDSDEFLIFSNFDDHSIGDLIVALERKGATRLAAPMIDMYPGPATNDSPVENDAPWKFSNYFDGSGYNLFVDKRGFSVMGGPRGRKFQEKNELIKYPVIFWDDRCFFGSSPHRPLPYERNFPELWGVLLHFKFYVDYREKIAEAVSEKQHFAESRYYANMQAEIERSGSISLYDEVISLEFLGAQQLVELGFMSKIEWDTLKR